MERIRTTYYNREMHSHCECVGKPSGGGLRGAGYPNAPQSKIYGGQNGVFAPQISAVHFDLNHQTFDQDIYQ